MTTKAGCSLRFAPWLRLKFLMISWNRRSTCSPEGFHIPTASLAGAVLEDALRKLSEAKGLPVPERQPSIS